MNELYELGAFDLLNGYRTKQFTPVEAVEACVRRITGLASTTNAHWYLASESALAQARQSSARWSAGSARPLDGVPVGVKDVIDVAGMPCTGGAPEHRHRVPDRDAAVVQMIRAAGGIVITKDATTEYAIGGAHNRLYGATVNPWSPDLWTGGSSTGGAAGLAARCLPLAVGTDGAGSNRIPASWCGVTGMTTTSGRVNQRGTMPLSWSMVTIGPMARSATDACLLLEAMLFGDQSKEVLPPAGSMDIPGPATLDGTVIGIPADWFESVCDREILDGLVQAAQVLADMGAEIVHVAMSENVTHCNDLAYQLFFTEAASVLYRKHAGAESMDPTVVRRADQGLFTSAQDYLRILRYRNQLQQELGRVLGGIDLLLTPTTPSTAPDLTKLTVRINGQESPLYESQGSWVVPFNFTGFPAVAVPSGLTSGGVPMSIQFVGKPFSDIALLGHVAAFQAMTEHHLCQPKLNRLTEPGATSRQGRPASLSTSDSAALDAAQSLNDLSWWIGESLDAGRATNVAQRMPRVMEALHWLRSVDGEGLGDEDSSPSAFERFLRSYAEVDRGNLS